jgi:hypothetical protein
MVKLIAESPLLAELRSALKDMLPPDWRWRLRVQDRPSEADAILEVTDPRGDTTRIRVELKTRLSPAEIVRQARWYGERGPWLLAAPLVGPRTRQILADEGMSWIDLTTGECVIAFGTLRIERLPARRGSVRVTGGGTINVRGVATDSGRRFVADLFSGKALRIVRWLLRDPDRKWTLDEMVSAASASPGFVSRTFATLERDAYMERERGASRLRDADGLLTAWAAAPPPSDRSMSRVSLLPTPQAILSAVGELPNAPRYALTAEAAAEKIAPYARFSRVELYVDDAGAWDRLLDLTAVPRGGNVDLILPADPGVFDGSFTSGDLSLVSRPQLYVDLKRRAGPASGAADFLLDRGAVWPRDARDDPQGVEAAAVGTIGPVTAVNG